MFVARVAAWLQASHPKKGTQKNKNIYQIIEVQPVAKATYQNIYQNIYQIIEA